MRCGWVLRSWVGTKRNIQVRWALESVSPSPGLGPALASCVTFGKSLRISVPALPNLATGIIILPTSCCKDSMRSYSTQHAARRTEGVRKKNIIASHIGLLAEGVPSTPSRFSGT